MRLWSRFPLDTRQSTVDTPIMRIGLVSREYPWRDPCGGVGMSTATLARALGEAGHAVTVFTQSPYARRRETTDGGVRVIGLPLEPPARMPARLAGFSGLVIRRWSRAAARAVSGPDGAGLEIIEAPDTAAESYDVLRLSRRPPVVVRIRGGTSLYLKTLGRFRWFHADVYRRERACLQRADAVAALTQRSLSENRAHYRLRLPDVTLLSNPVDTDVFAPADPPPPDVRPAILFSGRLDAVKGFDRMPGIVQCVWEQAPDTPFLFAGAGGTSPLPPDDPRIRFLGRVAFADMPGVYRRAALLVAPSRTDACPRVCAEAAACGLPAVGARGTGMDEMVVDGETGFCVDAADPAAVAVAVLTLLCDPARRRAMGAAARRRAVKHFSVPVIAAATVAFYTRVVRGAVGTVAPLRRPRVRPFA
jgi:D-inositol-3-phosphate glycosyltransferase